MGRTFFITAHIVAALLLTSWLLPQTRPFWDALDMQGFLYLNSWVKVGPKSQLFWARANLHIFDWIHDGLMVVPFLLFPSKVLKKMAGRLKTALFVALLILCTNALVNKLVLQKIVDVKRASPTLVVESACKLDKLVPQVGNKCYSSKSYPGDHATIALLFTSCCFILLGTPAGIIAFFYSLTTYLPRLVIGTHWLTDVIMGSLPITLIILAWVFATPFAHHCFRRLEKDETRRHI